jgi:DNA repair protein RadD
VIPRDYQQEAVKAARSRTAAHGNTILMLPTGAGKTAVAGFYIGEEAQAQRNTRTLVLQHTDELIEQNLASIGAITGLSTSVVKASRDDWSGRIVFGSVQTLARANRRQALGQVSHVIIDECHRAAADSYQNIVADIRALNPAVKLLGLSATPSRGDGRSLRKVFTNVGYQLKIGTLIARGMLVPPRTFTIGLGIDEELAGIDATAGDFDMRQADKVLNRSVLNEAVVAHWKDRAGDRRTIFFCSTIAHAEAVAASFMAADVTAAVVSGDMPADHRADVIARFDRGEIQLLVNCMVLTEGFDSQPVGCIGILRPMLHKSTFIQAIGRGLRKVDPERYPGIIKTDCIVLDFAGAALRHGSLEQEISLDNDDPEPGQAPYKCCPSCEAEVPLGTSECPICGFGFERRSSAKRVLTDFELMEIDLLNRSPFKWCDLHGDGASLMASGFDAWAGVFSDGTLWHALGRPRAKATRVLAIGTRVQALAAADDFLRSTESSQAAAKSRGWINEPASFKQMAKLAEAGIGVSALDFGFSKYDANCRLNFHWNRGAIERLVNAMQTRMAA